MKWYSYVETTVGFSAPTYKVLSAKQIITQYYTYWLENMLDRARDQLSISYIQRQYDCIEDFCTLHWAVEQEAVNHCILDEVLMAHVGKDEFKFIDVKSKLTGKTIQELNDTVAGIKAPTSKLVEHAKDITLG